MKALIKFYFYFIIIFVSPDLSYCQVWIKTFDIQNHISPIKIQETYDGGILLAADISNGSEWVIGWIIKMDVNGNVLWDKKLGNGISVWNILSMDVTNDGGIIVAGSCDTLGIQNDPFLLKLSACGEIEFCKIFFTPNRTDYAQEILALDDGNIILQVHGWGTIDTIGQYVELIMTDSNGDVLWENYYFQQNSFGYPFYEYSLCLTDDNNFLISGQCEHTIVGQQTPLWGWPMLILSDYNGNLIWELPWGYSLPFSEMVRGDGFQSTVIDNTIYTVISNYHWAGANHYSPCLIKTSVSGIEISYKDIIDNTNFGKATTITKLSDSVLIIGSAYAKQGFQGLCVLKTNNGGILIQEKVLNNSEYLPNDAILTKDRKYLITAPDWSNYWIMHLWKLNENLEYDSIYTVPRTYDSLCPYPITSSTLFSTCDLATSVQEQAWNTERVRMHVYPNPASSALHVGLPEAIQKNSSTAHLQVSTVFHRWNKPLWLTASDMFGREVFRKEVYLQEKEIRLDVSSWSPGLYLLRLNDSNTTVAEEKVVVE